MEAMGDELRSVLIGTAGLSVAGGIALYLTLVRGGITAGDARLRTTIRFAVAAILFQAGHFVEESTTGFYRRFPELFSLAAWSPRFFLLFNFFWLAVWGVSIWGLAARRRAALFPLWFLGIGCLANGVVHPVMAVRSGGYFPGLVTSPLVGVVGVLLLRNLFSATGANDRPLQ